MKERKEKEGEGGKGERGEKGGTEEGGDKQEGGRRMEGEGSFFPPTVMVTGDLCWQTEPLLWAREMAIRSFGGAAP